MFILFHFARSKVTVSGRGLIGFGREGMLQQLFGQPEHKQLLFLMSVFAPKQHAFFESVANGAAPQFVHYTSAEVACSIIQNKSIWLRRCSSMNDYQEVRYGINLINKYLKNKNDTVKDALNGVFEGSYKEIFENLDGWLFNHEFHTYLTCVSRHEAHEDKIGRLSMWRAYGGRSGVGLVLDGSIFATFSDAIGAYSTQVEYLTDQQFEDELDQFVSRLKEHSEHLRHLGRDGFIAKCVQYFRKLMIGTKHPGFAEEQEWRIYHTPDFDPAGVLKKHVKIVKGVPEIIYELPIQPVPGIPNLTLKDLLKGIIVGPADNPYDIAEAIEHTLSLNKFENVKDLVAISGIPLRWS